MFTHYNVISVHPHVKQKLVETCVAVCGEDRPKVWGNRPTEHHCTSSIAHTHPVGGREGGERGGVQFRSFGAGRGGEDSGVEGEVPLKGCAGGQRESGVR